MKKIILLILSIVLLTGCTCQYNIKISENEFYEEVIINSENQNEKNNLKNNWEIPIYKDDYIATKISDSITETNFDTYKYQLDNNKIKFYNTYSITDIQNSTAIYNCFDNVTVMEYDEKLIISTGKNIKCYNSYPTLSKVKINIYSDKEVITHNADEHSGNRYSWTLEKNNKKGINITFKNSSNNSPSSSSNKKTQNNKNNDYIMEIFILILIVLLIIGYFVYIKIKERDRQNNIID